MWFSDYVTVWEFHFLWHYMMGGMCAVVNIDSEIGLYFCYCSFHSVSIVSIVSQFDTVHFVTITCSTFMSKILFCMTEHWEQTWILIANSFKLCTLSENYNSCVFACYRRWTTVRRVCVCVTISCYRWFRGKCYAFSFCMFALLKELFGEGTYM